MQSNSSCNSHAQVEQSFLHKHTPDVRKQVQDVCCQHHVTPTVAPHIFHVWDPKCRLGPQVPSPHNPVNDKTLPPMVSKPCQCSRPRLTCRLAFSTAADSLSRSPKRPDTWWDSVMGQQRPMAAATATPVPAGITAPLAAAAAVGAARHDAISNYWQCLPACLNPIIPPASSGMLFTAMHPVVRAMSVWLRAQPHKCVCTERRE